MVPPLPRSMRCCRKLEQGLHVMAGFQACHGTDQGIHGTNVTRVQDCIEHFPFHTPDLGCQRRAEECFPGFQIIPGACGFQQFRQEITQRLSGHIRYVRQGSGDPVFIEVAAETGKIIHIAQQDHNVTGRSAVLEFLLHCRKDAAHLRFCTRSFQKLQMRCPFRTAPILPVGGKGCQIRFPLPLSRHRFESKAEPHERLLQPARRCADLRPFGIIEKTEGNVTACGQGIHQCQLNTAQPVEFTETESFPRQGQFRPGKAAESGFIQVLEIAQPLLRQEAAVRRVQERQFQILLPFFPGAVPGKDGLLPFLRCNALLFQFFQETQQAFPESLLLREAVKIGKRPFCFQILDGLFEKFQLRIAGDDGDRFGAAAHFQDAPGQIIDGSCPDASRPPHETAEELIGNDIKHFAGLQPGRFFDKCIPHGFPKRCGIKDFHLAPPSIRTEKKSLQKKGQAGKSRPFGRGSPARPLQQRMARRLFFSGRFGHWFRFCRFHAIQFDDDDVHPIHIKISQRNDFPDNGFAQCLHHFRYDGPVLDIDTHFK